MEQVSRDKSLQARRRRKSIRPSTTDDNEAYSDLDARIDLFIFMAGRRKEFCHLKVTGALPGTDVLQTLIWSYMNKNLCLLIFQTIAADCNFFSSHSVT